MPKIETGNIEGYESMTVEQKLSALENYELPDSNSELERYKNAVSKANSEAASWKKKFQTQLSNDERSKQEREDELTTLRSKVEEMEKEKLVTGHTARFLALGYEESLAKETAQALANGETDKVFANQKKFLETHDKAYKASLMKKTPTPPSGQSGEPKKDCTAMIVDAQSRGDFGAAAYYMRLREQEKTN